MSDSTQMVKRQETTPATTDGQAIEFQCASPLVDVYENDDEILIRADMPGVRADSLEIQLESDELAIRGTQRQLAGSKLAPLEYRRTFTVPQTIDPDSVAAELDSGVLQITLGKSQAAKPRRIEVQTG